MTMTVMKLTFAYTLLSVFNDTPLLLLMCVYCILPTLSFSVSNMTLSYLSYYFSWIFICLSWKSTSKLDMAYEYETLIRGIALFVWLCITTQ